MDAISDIAVSTSMDLLRDNLSEFAHLRGVSPQGAPAGSQALLAGHTSKSLAAVQTLDSRDTHSDKALLITCLRKQGVEVQVGGIVMSYRSDTPHDRLLDASGVHVALADYARQDAELSKTQGLVTLQGQYQLRSELAGKVFSGPTIDGWTQDLGRNKTLRHLRQEGLAPLPEGMVKVSYDRACNRTVTRPEQERSRGLER